MKMFLVIWLMMVGIIFSPGCGQKPEWKTYNYYDANLSVESPYPLISQASGKTDFLAKTQGLNENFEVVIGLRKSKPGSDLNLNFQKVIDGLKKDKNYSSLVFDNKPLTESSDGELMISAILNASSKPKRIKMRYIGKKDAEVGGVAVTYKDNNAELETMATRVINSFKFIH